MKKLIMMALLLALAIGLLTACVAVEDAPTPARGVWTDNTYVNEHLNLRFSMPPWWGAASDAEVAMLVDLTPDLFAAAGHDLGEEFWDAVDVLLVVDMLASDPFEGSSVQIIYERLPFPMSRFNEEEYIRLTMVNMADMGRLYEVPGTTTIGDYEWYLFRNHMDMFEGAVVTNHFVNIRSGFVRMIAISYSTAVRSPMDEILAMFTSLDEPAPPQPVSDMALVGAWAWDEDYSYIYEFFADGTARRGFYPNLMEFTWFADAADRHLTMNFGGWHESWTYIIRGDVITLDNRIYDEIYHYIRWEGDFIESEFHDVDFTGHPLIGTWAWDNNADFVYVFETDGTGTRGFSNQILQFYWYAYDDHLLMDVGAMVESWTFVISDNVLTIDSNQQAGLTWSYIRQ